MIIMATASINKMVILYLVIHAYSTLIVLFIYFNNIFKLIIFFFCDPDWILICIWFYYQNFIQLSCSLLQNSLFNLKSSQCQQIISSSYIRMYQSDPPTYQKHAMEYNEQPNPQTKLILNAQKAVYWVQLRFLPKCDTKQHIPGDHHTHEYDRPSVCHMMFIDINFRKDINQIMLNRLDQIQKSIYEK